MSRGSVRCLAYFAVLMTSAVSAQTDGSQGEDPMVLEEVIVTATKREANLQALPLSVGVLSGRQLTDINAIGLDDYWRMIPSLNVKSGPVGGDSVIIRGLSDTSSFFQNDSLNAFYMDDTALTHVPGLYATPGDPALVDIARIEVLRGPQGTLVGANAMGGAIRVITNEPDLENPLRKFELNLGSTAHGGVNYGGSLILNQPLAEGDSALRLAAFYQDDDGFIHDIGTNRRDVNGEQRVGARLAWLWNATESFELLARVSSEDIKSDGFGYADPVGKPPLGLGTEGDNQVALLVPEARDEGLDLASLRLRWRLGWGEIYSSTSWYEKDIDLDIDFSPEFNGGGPLWFPAPGFTRLDQRDISQEFRFSSNSDSALEWLLGLYYLDQEAARFDTFGVPGFLEICPGCLPGEVILLFHEQSNRVDLAAFGEVAWRFKTAWELTLGGRWQRIERDLVNSGFIFEAPLDSQDARDWDGFVPKLSLSWDASKRTMVYGLVSEGFRSGQFNTSVAVVACGARPLIDSDRLTNYEIGVKSRLAEDRVGLNLSVFHIDWEDVQTSIFNSACGFFEQLNAGDATSDGLELEFSALVSDSFEIQGGLGYNDAKLAEDSPVFNAPKGQRIPNVPKLTANLAGTWRFAWNERTGGFLRADVQYVGSRTTKFDPTQPIPLLTKLDDYFLAHLRLGTERGSWHAELFVENLFDERADLFCCRFAVETYINRPRTFGLRTVWQFE